MRLEAGIAAAGNGGLHTGLRVAGAAKKIFYFFSKNVTLFKLFSILYMNKKIGKENERQNAESA